MVIALMLMEAAVEFGSEVRRVAGKVVSMAQSWLTFGQDGVS